MGAQSICFKQLDGTKSTPKFTDTISQLKMINKTTSNCMTGNILQKFTQKKLASLEFTYHTTT